MGLGMDLSGIKCIMVDVSDAAMRKKYRAI